MKIENENSFVKALQTEINLFLGAGFSVLAKDSEGSPLPIGNSLSQELCEKFNKPEFSGLELPQLAAILHTIDKKSFHQFLRNRYSISQFDPKYLLLERIRVKAIFTTNIDDLVYKIYAESISHYLNDLDFRGPSHGGKRCIDVVTLHGCVRDLSRPLRFSTLELATAFSADQDRWSALTNRIQQSPTLFWGYSLRDAGTLQALNQETIQGRVHAEKWIVVRPDSADVATLAYFRALNFQIIEAETSELLNYFSSINSAEVFLSPRDNRTTQKIFPEYSIPELGQVVVRPILDFYLGAPPEWSDIYSSQIHRTRHFQSAQNAINSGRLTLIIGLPGCGKSTLLMQLAASTKSAAHKLFLTNITPEQAEFLLRRLNDERALIFLDNFTDSLEAFEILAKKASIQIVAADRDYSFGIISHRVPTANAEILDVTELAPTDIQACLERIPSAICSNSLRLKKGNGESESLFEIIEANVTQPTLSHRYVQVLKELHKTDPVLRNLLIMLCYVQSCHTECSMDMLYAFLRGVARDYKEIYEMVERLGAMIREYSDVNAAKQDFYLPRSKIVADSVLAQASDAALKEMLLQFHTNVSPYRIWRYDNFKKRAYDANLMTRAFHKWEEGREFYEKVFHRENSPYLLQQKALYLSRNNQHKEAFEVVDQAVTMSGGRIWSIINSQAVIFFNANIEHQDREAARTQLKRSMEMLTNCYASDKRKPFHATIFGEQAIKFWNSYGDEDGHKYLQTASLWLSKEAEKAPWDRKIKYLKNRVNNTLPRT